MFTAALIFTFMFGGMAYGALAIARRSATVAAVLFKWTAVLLIFLTGRFFVSATVSALKSPMSTAVLFVCVAVFLLWIVAENVKSPKSATRQQENGGAYDHDPRFPASDNYQPQTYQQLPPPPQTYQQPQQPPWTGGYQK